MSRSACFAHAAHRKSVRCRLPSNGWSCGQTSGTFDCTAAACQAYHTEIGASPYGISVSAITQICHSAWALTWLSPSLSSSKTGMFFIRCTLSFRLPGSGLRPISKNLSFFRLEASSVREFPFLTKTGAAKAAPVKTRSVCYCSLACQRTVTRPVIPDRLRRWTGRIQAATLFLRAGQQVTGTGLNSNICFCLAVFLRICASASLTAEDLRKPELYRPRFLRTWRSS